MGGGPKCVKMTPTVQQRISVLTDTGFSMRV